MLLLKVLFSVLYFGLAAFAGYEAWRDRKLPRRRRTVSLLDAHEESNHVMGSLDE